MPFSVQSFPGSIGNWQWAIGKGCRYSGSLTIRESPLPIAYCLLHSGSPTIRESPLPIVNCQLIGKGCRYSGSPQFAKLLCLLSIVYCLLSIAY
jgi:hypothetical protein